MTSPPISLKTQLLCTIVGSIVATAVVLTTLAYRAQVSNLEDEARRIVRMAARSRASAIERLIAGQQQRAQHFLTAAASLCGEQTRSGGIAWELGCAGRALRELRASERANGAVLTNRDRRIATTGVALAGGLPIPTPLARLIERDGELTYVILAQMNDVAVRVQFALRDLSALLDQPFVLGGTGELFLRDSAGILLASAGARRAPVPAGVAESSHSCAGGPSEWSEMGDRGVDTIHDVHPVAAFAQPMCVDAHVSHADALIPARELLVDLLTPAALFAAMGGVLALFAAQWMTAPVQRLAASARALHAGDFGRPIPAGGPSDIRALAEALAGMAQALGEQMTRERSARHEAETANRAKDEFLAVLSHELSTPLTSTLGWTRLLRGGRLDAAKADRAIAAIERSTQKQQRLVEDLLDVSRIVAGRLQLDLIVVTLNDSVGAALEQLGVIAEEKGVMLETLFEAAPVVRADPLRLEQIVRNLVFNAIKFTAPGGRVTIRVHEVDNWVELGVSDTGIGIPAEFLPRVFEPFQQADAGPRRAYGGLGLGLSIVHHLVRLHGGVIQATSRGLGFGASFVMRLPLLPTAVLEVDQGARRRQAVWR